MRANLAFYWLLICGANNLASIAESNRQPTHVNTQSSRMSFELLYIVLQSALSGCIGSTHSTVIENLPSIVDDPTWHFILKL